MRAKKILASALMTGAMLSQMVVPAMAANITMNGVGHEFKAYKLMNLSTSIKSTCTHLDEDGTLKEGASHEDDCYAYRYEINSKYADALRAASLSSWDTDGDSKYSDEEILAGIRELDAEGMRTFADTLYDSGIKGKLDADIIANGKVFENADQGYYLIEESQLDGAVDDSSDAKSLVMLDTLGQEGVTVDLKDSAPTITKKIKLNDGTLVDAVDVYYGDYVTFQLKIDMPDNIEDLPKDMKFTVHDNAAGLDLDNQENHLTVKKVSGETTSDFTGGTFIFSGTKDDCEMHYTFTVSPDSGMKAGDSIIVEYQGKLNKDTMQSVSTGNTNDAFLEFTSNPYDTDETNETPHDKVTVLTYKMTVNKKDEDGAALKGAQFELKKLTSDNEWATLENNVDIISTVEGEVVFTFAGLDAGKYKLVETVVPDGYNKADDLEFSIEAEYDTEADEPKLTSFKVLDAEGNEFDSEKITVSAEGTIATDVTNTTGIKLPTTGGAGVYALYIGGALLLVGAGVAMVVLNSKKNKKNTDAE